jgi:hypothetical protein
MTSVVADVIDQTGRLIRSTTCRLGGARSRDTHRGGNFVPSS